MSMLRRRMMFQKKEESEWDYELYPEDGSDEGEFVAKKINVIKGQILTLNYFATKYSGYLLDARPDIHNVYYGAVGGDTYKIVTNKEDTCFFEATSDATITIAGHRLANDGELSPNSMDRFYGRYIKIKVN